jgi:hypothetical protein
MYAGCLLARLRPAGLPITAVLPLVDAIERIRVLRPAASQYDWLALQSGGVYFLAVFLILPGTAFAFGRLLFEFLRRRAV